MERLIEIGLMDRKIDWSIFNVLKNMNEFEKSILENVETVHTNHLKRNNNNNYNN